MAKETKRFVYVEPDDYFPKEILDKVFGEIDEEQAKSTPKDCDNKAEQKGNGKGFAEKSEKLWFLRSRSRLTKR